MTLFALTRFDVADYVSALFLVYIILIFLNVLISWIPRMPYNRALRATLDFIKETTDPYLNFSGAFCRRSAVAALRSTSVRSSA